MATTIDSLPDDPAVLKALLLHQQTENIQQRQELTKQQKNNHALQVQVNSLLESLRLERYRKYGKSSEKSPGQQELFVEAEQLTAEVALEDETSAANASATSAPIPKSKSAPKSRKPLPAKLPRVKNIIELDSSERQCPCGCEMTEIGEQISEQIDIVPAQVQVLQTVRKKYACKHCEESIKTAPAPAVLLPKAMASANTMAYVITAKYADGLPLYRLSEILKRHDIVMSRQTLSESVLSVASKVEILIDHMRQQLLHHDLIYMDETGVQVLNEPGKTAESKSYMWVQRGGPPERPVIHFHYDPSRATRVPKTLLDGFEGALMTDGYEPYRKVAADSDLIHLCCWAHARRKFVEAKSAQPKGKSGRADKAIAFIAKLYRVETECKDLPSPVRYEQRQSQSKVLLEEFKHWLDDTQQKVAPKNALGKAVNYTLKYWKELSRYIDDGHWPIDNNLTENAIRPFVIGRKAWLFSNSQRGATASANLYSLIETAKANGKEPYAYLSWMLNQLPTTPPDQVDMLMPWNMPTVNG